MAGILPQGKQYFENSAGQPLAGGRLYTYLAGTSTPKATYADQAGLVPNTNPIILDARGEALVYWSGAYKVELRDAANSLLWTVDNIFLDAGGFIFEGVPIADFFKSKNDLIVDSISALRAVDKTKFTRVFVTGYYSVGDGGGGQYWYDSTDTTSADNGGTVIVAADGGRWKLPTVGAVTVKQFGAKGDGATDDGAAFVAAAATLREIHIPYTSAGYNIGASAIPISSGQYFRGENLVLLKSTSATGAFLMQGYDIASGLQNVRFDMTGAPVGSTAVLFDTTVNVVWRVRLDNLRFDNCYSAIKQSAGPAYVTDIIAKDISCVRPKGVQIQFTLSRGSFKWERVNIDPTVDGAAGSLVTYSLAKFVNYAGLELYKFDVAGQNAFKPQVYDANAIGIEIDNTGAPAGTGFLWMDRVRVESSMGPGISIKGNNFFYGNMVETFSTLGHGIRFLNCTIGQFANMYARGGKDQPGKLAGQNGIYFDTCTDFVGSSVSADSNDGAGILVANSANIVLGNLRASNSGTYGYQESGTASGNAVDNAAFNGNTTAPFSIVNARISNAKNGITRLADSAAFYAHKNGVDQTGVVPATFTLVTFGTAAIASVAYNTGTSRWTPPAGNYRISASLTITVNVVSGAELTILIYKNGVALYQADYYPGAAAGTTISIDRPVVSNGTDYFEVYVYLVGAGNKTIGGAIAQSSFEGSPI